MLEQLWNAGFTVAAHLLNKCWRDSMGVLPDDEQAELWFRRAAEAGHDFSQYALGKLLQSQKRMDEVVSRYEKAAAQDNSYADCWLGKLYFEGKAVSKDVPGAVDHLTASAEQGNQFAQYALGRLYLDGREVPRDPDQSWDWFSAMAEQGNKYAQFFLAHFNDTQSSYASGRHQAASPPGADIPGQLRAACRTGGTWCGPKAAPKDQGEEDRHGPQAG